LDVAIKGQGFGPASFKKKLYKNTEFRTKILRIHKSNWTPNKGGNGVLSYTVPLHGWKQHAKLKETVARRLRSEAKLKRMDETNPAYRRIHAFARLCACLEESLCWRLGLPY
jgi:hypothetical protein